MIYFDHAATTAVCPQAAEAAYRSMTEAFGNPSARYPLGTSAAKALARNREDVAAALGCHSDEVYFTSCGTESNNWAVRGAAESGKHTGRHIITTAVEHSAVLEPIRALAGQGWEVTFLKPDRTGNISLSDLENALRPDTVLVSMMLVNNELGTLLPVCEAARLLRRRHSAALLHTDAVQGFLKIPFSPRELGVDLLSVSGHKVHAPKGVGALYIRRGLRFPGLLLGGGQESGLRSGTEATAQIAAFAAACRVGLEHREDSAAHCLQLKEYLQRRLKEEVPQVTVLAPGQAPHILALTMSGYKSEVLVRVLGDKGICVSAGSACHRGKPSHVYAALELSRPHRDGAFRVSFDRSNTREDVEVLVTALKDAAQTLFPSMS